MTNTWHDHDSHIWSYKYVTWPIYMCDTTRHDSFMYVTLFDTCDKTHAYIWHDSSVYVTWLSHICGTTHPYMCGWLMAQPWVSQISSIYVWLSHGWAMSQPDLIHICAAESWLSHASLSLSLSLAEPWLSHTYIYGWAMTQAHIYRWDPCMWDDLLIYVFIYIYERVVSHIWMSSIYETRRWCNMTHPYIVSPIILRSLPIVATPYQNGDSFMCVTLMCTYRNALLYVPHLTHTWMSHGTYRNAFRLAGFLTL